MRPGQGRPTLAGVSPGTGNHILRRANRATGNHDREVNAMSLYETNLIIWCVSVVAGLILWPIHWHLELRLRRRIIRGAIEDGR
jgi:hypothetical protein